LGKARVFLTGATGFVGSHVLRALRAAGYDVVALVRPSEGAERARRLDGAAPVAGDLRRPGALVAAMAACRYLVHCAARYSFAPADRADLRAVNVRGTAGLLEAARIAGIERAVVTGSAGADEDSAYHRSKLEQERAAVAARVPAVLVLPASVVGPGDAKPTPTGRMVLDFARGRVFAAPPGGGLNLVAVEDVAAAHVLALERGRPRERYFIGGENLGLDDVWRLLAEVTGRPAPRWRIPHALALALGYLDEARGRLRPHAAPRVPLEGVRLAVRHHYIDDAKARAELGYRSGSVRDALARAVAWYRDHGYLLHESGRAAATPGNGGRH
jgi:dihydroflavonol-4-reductase